MTTIPRRPLRATPSNLGITRENDYIEHLGLSLIQDRSGCENIDRSVAYLAMKSLVKALQGVGRAKNPLISHWQLYSMTISFLTQTASLYFLMRFISSLWYLSFVKSNSSG